MRAAIAAAEVGDDHLDGDPTTRRLEQRVAALLGKEAALFFPTGTMANQAAVHVHAKPGTEILVDDDAHLINLTSAGVAALAGVQARFIRPTGRTFDAADLRRAARAPSRYSPKPSLVSVENTHNGAGGSITSLADLREIRSVASEIDVPLHLDGARLWNVEAATRVPVAEYASCADSVMVSFSKGLGAPVGAALAGSAEAMDAAWTARKRLGWCPPSVRNHRGWRVVWTGEQSPAADRRPRQRHSVRGDRGRRRVAPLSCRRTRTSSWSISRPRFRRRTSRSGLPPAAFS
jgi:threonine aldolase